MAQTDVQVHDKAFEPPRRGRTPLIRVDDLIAYAQKHPGQWISKAFEERVANSVVRQVKSKYENDQNMEICSLREGQDTRTVYIRVWQ